MGSIRTCCARGSGELCIHQGDETQSGSRGHVGGTREKVFQNLWVSRGLAPEMPSESSNESSLEVKQDRK